MAWIGLVIEQPKAKADKKGGKGKKNVGEEEKRLEWEEKKRTTEINK